MGRERFSLVSDEVQRESMIRSQIQSGEMTPEIFVNLPAEDKKAVDEILFKMASEKIEPNQGTSALEFILFAFMRIMLRKINGMSLTAEDVEVEEKLNAILALHEMTDNKTPNNEWLFDYMGYAYVKSSEFLSNRKDHIERKRATIGHV